MKHVVEQRELDKLIAILDERKEPVRCREIAVLLSRWLEDPLLNLSPTQRAAIEQALDRYAIHEGEKKK